MVFDENIRQFGLLKNICWPGWERCAFALTCAHTHTILKAYVWYVTFLNYCMVCFPNLLWTHNFFTLLITLFMIALAKCSVHLYSLFIYFLDKVTFGFSCTCYMLNHSTSKALQVFFLFVYVICSRLFSFYIISLMPIILSSILTEPLAQGFSFEFWEIFKDAYLVKQLQMTACVYCQANIGLG